jgi:hypothetical protein
MKAKNKKYKENLMKETWKRPFMTPRLMEKVNIKVDLK